MAHVPIHRPEALPGDPNAAADALLGGAGFDPSMMMTDNEPIGGMWSGPTGPMDPQTGDLFAGPYANPEGIANFYNESYVQDLWNGLPLEYKVQLQDQLVAFGLARKVVPGELDGGAGGTEAGIRELLSRSNRNGTSWQATLKRLQELDSKGLLDVGDQDVEPVFNFVSRDYLPTDPAEIDLSIRDLAKQMFRGTDIELSDEEVQTLRGKFEGFLREQHFAEEQQRLSEEMAGFEANVASSEGRKVHANVPSVPQVDAEARFRQVFEERMKPKTDAIEQMAVDDQSRQVLAGSLGSVMQFATGR